MGDKSATMIDRMNSNDVEYEYIKKRAYDREDWCHWKPGPASKGRALKKVSRVRVRVESPCGMKVDLKKLKSLNYPML